MLISLSLGRLGSQLHIIYCVHISWATPSSLVRITTHPFPSFTPRYGLDGLDGFLFLFFFIFNFFIFFFLA